MLQKTARSYLRVIVTIAVTLIIAGSVVVSVLASLENLRFIRLKGQIFDITQFASSMATQQKNFALTPGEDMWANLAHFGLISSASAPINPWQNEIRAYIINSTLIRLETDIPTRDCRRLAFSILDHQLPGIGLVSMDVRAATTRIWTQIYPSSAAHVRAISNVLFGCGAIDNAHLGLVFRIRDSQPAGG